MTELWLIRHPRPRVAADVCYGQLDLEVAAEERAAAAARLPSLPAAARLRSSPARRCLDLARCWQPAPAIDPRLQERAFGAWEGRTWDDIGRAAVDAWAADPWDYAPPGGESTRAFVERVHAALDEELALGGVAVWVSHQGVARAVAGRLLDLPDTEWQALTLGFGDLWRFSRQASGWTLSPAPD